LIVACTKNEKPVTQNTVNQTSKEITVEQAFPGKKGEIKEGYLFGEKIRYSVIDGKNIYQGDIILPNKMLSQTSENGRLNGAIIAAYSSYRWPNNIVPFVIDQTLPDQFRVTDAIANWQANTPFRFVPRTTETDYVLFRPVNNGIFSEGVGRLGGEQEIGLDNTAITGNVIHEIGHAVGLFHEHQRVDRNQSIFII
jgi:predicted Zn-dependent protease